MFNVLRRIHLDRLHPREVPKPHPHHEVKGPARGLSIWPSGPYYLLPAANHPRGSCSLQGAILRSRSIPERQTGLVFNRVARFLRCRNGGRQISIVCCQKSPIEHDTGLTESFSTQAWPSFSTHTSSPPSTTHVLNVKGVFSQVHKELGPMIDLPSDNGMHSIQILSGEASHAKALGIFWRNIARPRCMRNHHHYGR